jgi:hypothetical protein
MTGPTNAEFATTNAQLASLTRRMNRQFLLLLVLIFLASAFSGFTYWSHRSLRTWAGAIDGPLPNWGHIPSETGQLSSYLSHISTELHEHVSLLEPGAQVAHTSAGDKHSDPPPPPKW